MKISSNNQLSYFILAPFYILALLLLLCQDSSAQQSPFSISIAPSIRVRSTLMNAFNFRYIRQNIYIPHLYERNIQGFGLGPQIRLSLGTEWSLSYTPFVRYDYAYSTIETQTDSLSGFLVYERNDRKKVLIDQQFWLTRQLFSRYQHWYTPSAVSIGWGIINSGQRYYLKNGRFVNRFIRAETNTVDLATNFGSPDGRWSNLLAVHYFYQGMTNNRDDQFLSYSLTVGYRLIPRKSKLGQ